MYCLTNIMVDRTCNSWETSEICNIFFIKIEGKRNNAEFMGADGTIILKWVLTK